VQPVNSKDLSARLSKRLANFNLGDSVIGKLADQILVDGLSIGWFDPCIYGICVDYFTDHLPRLEGLSSNPFVSIYEVFPYGIIQWDRFLVRVAYRVDELEGKGLVREFNR
jgi:hypothetical protein